MAPSPHTLLLSRRSVRLIASLLLVLGGVAWAWQAWSRYTRHSLTWELVNAIDSAQPETRAVDEALAERVTALIRRGADPNGKVLSPWMLEGDPDEYTTALHVAATRPFPQTVRALLKLGADVNAADTFGRTPLIWGAWVGYPEGVQVLIDSGAALDRTDQWGDTALDRACEFDESGRNARVLVRAGAKHSPQGRKKCSRHRRGVVRRS